MITKTYIRIQVSGDNANWKTISKDGLYYTNEMHKDLKSLHGFDASEEMASILASEAKAVFKRHFDK